MKYRVLFYLLAMTAFAIVSLYGIAANVAILVPPKKVDQAVIASLPVWKGEPAQVLSHIDLTASFATHTQWTFVVAEDQTPPPEVLPSSEVGHGPLAICFVNILVPHCAETQHGEGNMSWYIEAYHLTEDKIVYAGSGDTQPLLWLKTCSTGSGDGDCDVRATVYSYEAKQDRFVSDFSYNAGGANNNNNARFIESGPLRGDIVADHPTKNAPYTYMIELYGRGKAGRYVQILKYRGHTGYGDGNQLPVAYSEMPEILRRLGLWHRSDPLPIPPNTNCPNPTLLHSEEWCQ
jgi:hypothetical protein